MLDNQATDSNLTVAKEPAPRVHVSLVRVHDQNVHFACRKTKELSTGATAADERVHNKT
jgi:hypothetical protein